MSLYDGPYLRLLEPRTTNGVNLKYKLIDGKEVQQFKESHAPLSARKHFDAINAKLPRHLRTIIEVVGDVQKAPQHRNGRDLKPQRVERANPQPKAEKEEL